jgi:hypothetical protein
MMMIIIMEYSKGKVESKTTRTLNLLNNKTDNNLFVITSTSLYCNTCKKGIQENPLFCYIFIDYFCSNKCHIQKHKIHLENIVDVN